MVDTVSGHPPTNQLRYPGVSEQMQITHNYLPNLTNTNEETSTEVLTSN